MDLGKICKSSLLTKHFIRMQWDNIQSIEQSFRDVCGRSFEANDPFASFAVRVIKDEFSFVVKEIAATMLRYVAWDVNRFSVQHMVRDLLLSDLDPMLKDIIKE